MIFKEPGNIKIHRTRVIHLYEADYNLAMGLKWSAAMAISEGYQQLNPGQYGSRPSRGAHDPVFIEEFQLEISRASRKSLVQVNYDATSCYDRIIPNLAALVSQRYGVPQPAVQSNVRTLEQAQYKLRTELGLSDTHYSHNPEAPIYGTGQGSGNSPMIWCFFRACYSIAMKPRPTERIMKRQISATKHNSTWLDMWTIVMDKQTCFNTTISQRTKNFYCGLNMMRRHGTTFYTHLEEHSNFRNVPIN
jgi:hypothetical protein